MKAFALTTMLALAPVATSAATIDFTILPGFSTIDQNYGDVAGVLDVSYGYSYDGGVTVTLGGQIWPNSYFGPQGNTAALINPYGGASIMMIVLQALGGNTLTTYGANVASYSGLPPVLSVGTTGPANSWTTVVFNLGPDYDAGYQSVSYSVSAVPLPAAGLLLLGAVGGLGLMRRRRKVA